MIESFPASNETKELNESFPTSPKTSKNSKRKRNAHFFSTVFARGFAFPKLQFWERNVTRKNSAEKMRVSLPFGVFRRFWTRWKAPVERFCLVWCGKCFNHLRIYYLWGQRDENGQLQGARADTIFPDPAWVRAGFCSTHQDLSSDTKFGHIYDNIASDPSWK